MYNIIYLKINIVMTLIEEYFEFQDKYTKVYGEDTIVLMEVGSFFEIYQVGNLGKAKEIASVLNMILTKKNKNINEVTFKNPLMTGFPTVSLEKNVSRINAQSKYTVVLVKQRGQSPNITREVDEILSPGIQYRINTFKNNFLANIYVEYYRKNMFGIGISVVDITTGENYLMDSVSLEGFPDNPLSEIQQMVTKYGPSEIIVSMVDFESAESEATRIRVLLDEMVGKYTWKSCDSANYKVSFLNEMFSEIYKVKSILTPIEYLGLEHNQLAGNALIDSIGFIQKNNPCILDKMPRPEYINCAKYLTLNNDALSQLNVVDNNKKANRKGSLFELLNTTVTAAGGRLYGRRLSNPISSKEDLNAIYAEIDLFISDSKFAEVRREISPILDINRIWRRLVMRKGDPMDIWNLYTSIKILADMKKDFSWIPNLENLSNSAQSANKYIESIFDISRIEDSYLSNLEDNIFKKENPVLDKLEAELAEIKYQSQIIAEMFANHSFFTEKTKLVYTDKEGFYIETTPSRYKQYLGLNTAPKSDILAGFDVYKNKSKVRLTNDDLRKLSESKVIKIQKMSILIKEMFVKEVDEMYSAIGDDVESISAFISHIDVMAANAYNSVNLSLFKPELIDNEEGYSSVECHALRHPIVERLTHSEYIQNDVLFSNNKYGKVIFGVNSTGKSTLLKATGLAIIMAQAGMHVPSKMKLSPYQSLYTRITSGDDLFSNKSTFTVEMLELKQILEKADHNSMVLADELSHGTETNSGVSILAATINTLSKRKATFLFTTHLHQITGVRSIMDNKSIDLSHLSVNINPITGVIEYDRKLKDGAGESVYGILVAKGLGLADDFINDATNILNEVKSHRTQLDAITENNTNKYNSNKVNKNCEICGFQSSETHHIKEQAAFKSQKYLEIQKNAKYNLVNVCNDCHKKIHSGKIVNLMYKQTTEGVELKIT